MQRSLLKRHYILLPLLSKIFKIFYQLFSSEVVDADKEVDYLCVSDIFVVLVHCHSNRRILLLINEPHESFELILCLKRIVTIKNFY